jgi:hypothetical protein
MSAQLYFLTVRLWIHCTETNNSCNCSVNCITTFDENISNIFDIQWTDSETCYLPISEQKTLSADTAAFWYRPSRPRDGFGQFGNYKHYSIIKLNRNISTVADFSAAAWALTIDNVIVVMSRHTAMPNSIHVNDLYVKWDENLNKICQQYIQSIVFIYSEY